MGTPLCISMLDVVVGAYRFCRRARYHLNESYTMFMRTHLTFRSIWLRLSIPTEFVSGIYIFLGFVFNDMRFIVLE